MDLDWKPIVHSASHVDIPEVTINYDKAALERLKQAKEPWLKSGRTDFSVWGVYEDIAKSGRFLLPFKEKPAKRFAELHAALSLENEGFTCWCCVSLFEGKRKLKKGKGPTRANTEEVRARAPWARQRWPSEIQNTLDCEPKNPDIAAYSEELDEWRFCEVKLDGEDVHPDQRRGSRCSIF